MDFTDKPLCSWSGIGRIHDRGRKAYAKGPHLRYCMKDPKRSGKRYTKDELNAVDQCLRLELTHSSQFSRERVDSPWHEVKASKLQEWHEEYLGRMLGSAEVTEMDVEERVMAVAPNEGQGSELGR